MNCCQKGHRSSSSKYFRIWDLCCRIPLFVHEGLTVTPKKTSHLPGILLPLKLYPLVVPHSRFVLCWHINKVMPTLCTRLELLWRFEWATAEIRPFYLISGHAVRLQVLLISSASANSRQPCLKPNHKLNVGLEVVLLSLAEDTFLQHSWKDNLNIYHAQANAALTCLYCNA